MTKEFDRRRFMQVTGAGLFAPAILRVTPVNAAEMRKMAGQLLVMGLPGNDAGDKSAKVLTKHIANGHASGAVLLRHNVKSRKMTLSLTRSFIGASKQALVSVDQEGGKVQRLSKKHGFTKIPEASWVSGNMDPKKARALYAAAGREMRKAGFNINLAPSVDVHDPKNPVIGKYGRSFGRDADRITAFASAFVSGMSSAGVACSLKHFPGHGSSRGDSHDGFVDITKTWTDKELIPFQKLANSAPLIMSAHLYHKTHSNGKMPITFSHKALTGLLRNTLKYDGVILTDDLDMGAIRKSFSLKQAVIKALQAGNDLLLMSNSLKYNGDLPVNATKWIADAVKDGQLSKGSITASYNRVMRLKAKYSA